ncbi:MAG TPA: proline dehydrogenase family protein [Thermoanaerobaculia bacterium]|nr:proline dehydrogenase family protein [Thermoanaerobaculia bacterium]
MSIARSLLLHASRSEWLAEEFRRRSFARRAVRRFMPGQDVEAALAASADLAGSALGTVFTNLGERTETAAAALAVRDHYLRLFDTIHERRLPAHVSVKLTHLGLSVDRTACLQSVLELARRAETTGSLLWIDMEESEYVDATLGIYRDAKREISRVGVCLQSYLRRTAADLEALLPLEPAIRLVKGAYREPAAIAFEKKKDTDRAFLQLAERMLDEAANRRAFPVFGTHDMKLVREIHAASERRGVARDAWEVHMLYGIRPGEQRELAAEGTAVRTLISYGENWFPWYMRRLAERPANVWFVVKNVIIR